MFFALMLTLALCVSFVLIQRHLLLPAPKNQLVLESPHHHIRRVDIPVRGKLLHGYVATPLTDSGPPQGLLYFNGRREHPTSIFRALSELPQHHVLCFIQHGLGPAWRKPGEGELMADSLAVLDWWARDAQIQVEQISVAGRSLGAGFAVRVAGARPVRHLTLISPLDQLITAVQSHLAWLPRWCLRDKFDSRCHIGQVRCPCLLIVAGEDSTVPVAASRALFNNWPGQLTEFLVSDCGHRGVLRRADVHRALARAVINPVQTTHPPPSGRPVARCPAAAHQTAAAGARPAQPAQHHP